MDIKLFEKLLDSKFENVYSKLDNIHEQTIKTNGRVTKLEDETRVVRFFSKYPKLILLVIIGLIVLLNLEGIKQIISML